MFQHWFTMALGSGWFNLELSLQASTGTNQIMFKNRYKSNYQMYKSSITAKRYIEKFLGKFRKSPDLCSGQLTWSEIVMFQWYCTIIEMQRRRRRLFLLSWNLSFRIFFKFTLFSMKVIKLMLFNGSFGWLLVNA